MTNLKKITIRSCNRTSCPNWDSDANGGHCMVIGNCDCHKDEDAVKVLQDALSHNIHFQIVGGFLYVED